ncbi:MAG: LruC domain-containing protein, partial [Bacteroidia bacterium]
DDLISDIKDNTLPTDFDYSTTGEYLLNIKVKSPSGEPMQYVPVILSVPVTADSFVKVFKGFTAQDGILKAELSLDVNVKDVLVQTPYIGLPQNHFLAVEQIEDYTIQNTGIDVPGQRFPVVSHKGGYTSNYNYLGTWDNNGVPNYKKHVRDGIPQAMLDDINSSLPEYKPVPQYNPDYIATNAETNTKVVKKADVWVTFVHEGAGYKNVLGYYTYNTNNPPSSVNDISKLNIVFPNVSYKGSGGGLVSGDKVYLGQFDPGTSIGWFVVANGYNATSKTVGAGNWIVFSDPNLNPEPNASQRNHMVQLYDESRDLIILGFEDILRNNSGCDNDFNDAIFYVSANPIEAIERKNLEGLKKAVDSDGDGVYDFDDEFPFDPTKSASSYSPATSTSGSLCYEDNWPNMGDYDFNDLVVDYKYTYYTDVSNNLTELKAEYTLKAIGASMRNGFGVQFNIAPSEVKSVYGSKLTENYVSVAANGCEKNQSKATIIVFDDAHRHLRRTSGSIYANTDNPNELAQYVTFTLTIKMNSGVNPKSLGKAPYNCFLVVNGNRGREVHMVGYEGTDKVDLNYYGTAADRSNPDINRYYQNKDNMPWVLHTPVPMVYPLEKENIYDCYPYFKEWAKSEGRSYTDWYKDNPGYRNKSKLFRP